MSKKNSEEIIKIQTMSDLDENLTSILSDLIATDAIETPTNTELTDGTTFGSRSRLDFDNFASCITGSDASLHQCSDENVSNLLVSHLNELTQTENTSIVDATTEQLDDVTSFDLDKPIDALLVSEPSEFISEDCSHPQLTIDDKSNDIQNATCLLNTIQNETLNDLENAQSILNEYNENENDISNIQNQIEIETKLPSNPNSEDEIRKSSTSNTVTEIATCEQNIESNQSIENEINLNTENESNQSITDQNIVDEDESNEDEHCETIIADEVVDEMLICESTSKQELRKRRRILVYDDGDSDNSELEIERERLMQSKSPTELTEINDDNQNNLINDVHCNPLNDVDDKAVDMSDDFIRDPTEKPGPKSKKLSTHLYNALKAKALLESAVVIPAKRKKKRIIDSDDESALNQPIANVDDIGLIADDNNLMPLNVSIEIEQKEIVIDTMPKIRIKNDLIREPVKESERIKNESLNRTTIQAKMEKYHAMNKRRNHKKKESTDIFGTSLNA